MNSSIIRFVLGYVLKMEAVLMLLPCIVAVLYREQTGFAYLLVAAGSMAFGTLMTIKKPKSHVFYLKEGCVATALSWIFLSFFGALPFWISGEIPSLIDALFETVSGFTTTGSSILADVEALSHCALFWRSFTHWIGGMGVIVFVLAILPQKETRSMHIMRAEIPGPTVGKLVSKTMLTARILYYFYTVITLIEALVLYLGNTPFFDSITIAFSTAGTGGFAIKNASIAAYNSLYIEIVVSLFMIIFGINFNLYYFLLMRRFRDVAKSEELWAYLGIVAFSTVTIAANIRHLYGAVGTSLRHAFFQVSSIITTTGYATVDFDQWPGYAKTVLVLLMFVGGCAGSTGGGLKVTRVVTLVKAAFMDMRKMIHPNAVVNVRMEGRAMPEKQVRGVQAYFSVYMLLYAVSWLLLSLNGFDLLSTFTALSACINNIGPGLGMVGPTGNFSAFAPWAKLLLSFDMLAGRLEIFPMLLLFVPSTWRGNRLRRWERRN